MEEICGFTKTLWSLCYKITPLTRWFHMRTLFSWTLMERFNANVLPKIECTIVDDIFYEDLTTCYVSYNILSWFTIDASWKYNAEIDSVEETNKVQLLQKCRKATQDQGWRWTIASERRCLLRRMIPCYNELWFIESVCTRSSCAIDDSLLLDIMGGNCYI